MTLSSNFETSLLETQWKDPYCSSALVHGLVEFTPIRILASSKKTQEPKRLADSSDQDNSSQITIIVETVDDTEDTGGRRVNSPANSKGGSGLDTQATANGSNGSHTISKSKGTFVWGCFIFADISGEQNHSKSELPKTLMFLDLDFGIFWSY
jgi:hypothetical protein